MKNVYIIGSLRNPAVTSLANEIEQLGNFEVFSDWMAAGERADDSWQAYETTRGRSYEQALNGYAANHVFEYDAFHLDKAEIAVLLYPCGKSGFLEMGIHLGRGRTGYILFDTIPERWEVMVKFCPNICFSREQLFAALTLSDNMSQCNQRRQATG